MLSLSVVALAPEMAAQPVWKGSETHAKALFDAGRICELKGIWFSRGTN